MIDRLISFVRENRSVLLVFLLALIARIICIPFAQNVDADSVSRTYIALGWLEDPYIITNGVWAPFHTYFNAIFLAIIPDSVVAVEVQMILFASLTVFPLYRFTESLFNERGAIFASAIYAFSPVVFRNSFHNLSGIVYALFMMWAIYLLYRALKEDRVKLAVVAGISMMIAAGIRYEAWMLMGVFFLLSLFYRNWRVSFVFAAVSGIFPLFWMTGNYIEHNDLFYSVSWANHYNIELEGINDNVTPVEVIKRVFFFPFSLMLSLSPFLTLGFIYALVQSIRKRLWTRDRLIWIVPFAIVLPVYIYKAYNGGLLLHHRYSVTTVLLISPFIGFLFLDRKMWRIKTGVIAALVGLMIPMSFYFSTFPWHKPVRFSDDLKEAFYGLYMTSDQTEALPMHRNPDLVPFARDMASSAEGQPLIVDFPSWTEQSYIALESLRDGYVSIYFVNGNVHGSVDHLSIKKFIGEKPAGKIVLMDESALENSIQYYGEIAVLTEADSLKLRLELIERMGDIKAFNYEIVTEPIALEKLSKKTPINSVVEDIDFYKNKIYRDSYWYEQVRMQARDEDKPVHLKVEDNARYMIDNSDQ